MAYKTILVCLNEISRQPQLIAMARQLGIKFGAHVSALYIIPGVQIYPSAGYGAGPVIFDGTRVFYQNQLEKTRQAFETAMSLDKLSHDLHVVDYSLPLITNAAIENCRNADLVVISATSPDAEEGVEQDFAERFVLGAGRPVLVLPFKGQTTLNFDQMMVAWDDSREAARATFDALPFLQKSKNTRVVTVDVSVGGALPAGSIAETLDRHNVKTEITNVSSDGLSIGDTLLRAAKDYGADLIVLGAYGHSRFSEMIFGGATRHILKNLDRPVLMSH